ncbi:MAG TPA: VOC family protein [Burkholderiales bacterium]|nr:VOC family protein [Burkholderiales bacterium]
MPLQPYLFFEGRCEEALEFYKKTLGAQVQMLMRYSENPDPRGNPPGIAKEKVMHACFKVGDSEVMASDGMCAGKTKFDGFALSVPAASDADAKKKFDALAESGQVKMPLAKTFFASSFGMVADRFGLTWMVIAGQQP